jgi:hypothetical protein
MKPNFQRKDAKTHRREVAIPLTPGFSRVTSGKMTEKPFQWFPRAGGKPLKRFTSDAFSNTRLKPGVNKIFAPSRLCPFAPLR